MQEINFTQKYDELLEIKPLYKYKRELPEINFNQVGLEIEVAVNYHRDQYSFIKNLLKKIKQAVGKNGYFVKDATVLGDYEFEIILDPLYPNKIKKIFRRILDIVEYSQGAIEISKEKNCGIHLNFNKYDIDDKFAAHRRLMTLILENKDIFEENIYKQFKFRWDYNKYFAYQKHVSTKYIAVNYLAKKVVEVRNVRVNITPEELDYLIKSITLALFAERLTAKDIKKMKIDANFRTYKNVRKLFEKSFENVKNQEIVKYLNDHKLLIISLDGDEPEIITREDLEKKGQ